MGVVISEVSRWCLVLGLGWMEGMLQSVIMGVCCGLEVANDVVARW